MNLRHPQFFPLNFSRLTSASRILLLAMAWAVALCMPAQGEDVSKKATSTTTILTMSRDQDVFFENYHVTATRYFQFRTNGTFRELTREHLYVDEVDCGTWSQGKSGEITLVSSNHVRSIDCGPLEVNVYQLRHTNQLHRLKADIARFLESHKAENFTYEEVNAIPTSDDAPSIWPKDVRRPTGRRHLANLIPAIDRFLKDPHKTWLHGTPMTYKGVTFLFCKDFGSSRDLKFIQEMIDRAKNRGDLTLFYRRINRETFEKESGKTQEFIFYPEMNKRIPQPQEKK